MKRQDIYVECFVKGHGILTDIYNLSEDSVFLVRHTNPKNGQQYLFVVSWEEPSQTFLPENVVWLCFDPNSTYYLKALRRVGREPSEKFQHSWQPLYVWDDLWVTQTFSYEDLQTVGVNLPPTASMMQHGIVKMVQDNPDSRVIVTTDSRLSDARPPLDHNHTEKPITVFAPDVNVASAETPFIGKALVQTESGFSWSKLTEDMVDLNG
tara:strand:+ start:249 stop:875 length:627 start_codon:yes stop_codon:yes gene_type:complete